MKKKTLGIIIGIVIAIVAIVGCVALLLLKEKTPLTSEEFKTRMEEKGFIVSDLTSQFSEYDYYNKIYVAKSSDGTYQIEFYELSNSNYASQFFNTNKAIFVSSKSGSNSSASLNGKNYSKYTLSGDGIYTVLSRIDNTNILAKVDSSNKSTVKDIIKDLGY